MEDPHPKFMLLQIHPKQCGMTFRRSPANCLANEPTKKTINQGENTLLSINSNQSYPSFNSIKMLLTVMDFQITQRNQLHLII